jgi:hypothetical protein
MPIVIMTTTKTKTKIIETIDVTLIVTVTHRGDSHARK